jgi:uncharacterized protein YjbI with pentapeptide repeats
MMELDMPRANAVSAKMSWADLSGSDLSESQLSRAEFYGTNLEHIKYDEFTLQNLLNSRLNGTRMSEDLKKDLDSMPRQVV